MPFWKENQRHKNFGWKVSEILPLHRNEVTLTPPGPVNIISCRCERLAPTAEQGGATSGLKHTGSGYWVSGYFGHYQMLASGRATHQVAFVPVWTVDGVEKGQGLHPQ